MKGDLTRDTFDPAKHYSRVLAQQGRVTLDADQNEQTAILLHYMRTLARDLIGPYAAPVEDGGFILSADASGGLLISAGRYYVDGLLVENEKPCNYGAQPYYPIDDTDALLADIKNQTSRAFWLYLDVWERHLTSIEDSGIRETALNGPDTATRAQIVWQVRALPQSQVNLNPDGSKAKTFTCETPLTALPRLDQSALVARLDPGSKATDPCVISPDSKYRGLENQLYRVEVHTPGAAGVATFKWSRDNGAIASAWIGTDGNNLRAAESRGFVAGDWVELSDENDDLLGQPGVLVKITKVDGDLLAVDPASVPKGATIAWDANAVHPKVRRWNQADNERTTLTAGAVIVSEGGWVDLEDGLQIQFAKGGVYRTGDYWQIPARVATGDIEWPAEIFNGVSTALFLSPSGIEHHYAPLGYLAFTKGGVLKQQSCRCTFEPLSSCFKLPSAAVGEHLVKPTGVAAGTNLNMATGSTQAVLNLLK